MWAPCVRAWPASTAERAVRERDEAHGAAPGSPAPSPIPAGQRGHCWSRPAQQATRTVPIVFTLASDPVAEGLVSSLARPGGNATGLTQEAGEETAKRLELLKQASPGMSRVAVLWNQNAATRFAQAEVA